MYDDSIPSLITVETHIYENHLGQNVPCSINRYGQCIYGYRYFCSQCSFGLGGYASKCRNINCKIYNKSVISLKIDTELKETTNEFKGENIFCTSKWDCTGREGNCGYQNEYGQCKFAFKYWCCCGYGLEGMYCMCANTSCTRYISMNTEKDLESDFSNDIL